MDKISHLLDLHFDTNSAPPISNTGFRLSQNQFTLGLG